MSLTGQEAAHLAEFLAGIEKVWTANPSARRELETRWHEQSAGMFSDFMWKHRHGQLAERFDGAVEKAGQDAAADRRTLARVRALCAANRGRKTLRQDDLAIILSRCETCEHADAAYMQHRRPVCESCYATVAELASAAGTAAALAGTGGSAREPAAKLPHACLVCHGSLDAGGCYVFVEGTSAPDDVLTCIAHPNRNFSAREYAKLLAALPAAEKETS